MKKLLILIAFIFLISWADKPKTLKVEADVNTWAEILSVIDLSEAPAKQRVAVRDFIISQLNDTTINKIPK